LNKISPLAIIENGAKIGKDVEIAPYSFISSKATIGDGTKIGLYTTVYGKTTIGKNCNIFSHAVIGSIPQDLKYDGEEVELIIGDNNTIREFTLLNPGTKIGGGKTIIGSNNLIMGYVHIGHDARIGSHCILANGVTLAGHVQIDDYTVIGGLTPIHQFVHIGEGSMIGGASAISQDIPPFCLAEGNRALVKGLNIVGIRRRFDKETIEAIKNAYKTLFRSKKGIKESASKILNLTTNSEVKKMCNFILETKRGIPYERIKDEL